MGTRSVIAVANATGQFAAIYCHWDGCPSHHGPILRDHYKDIEKVNQLFALGDLSVLGKEIGTKHIFEDDHGDGCVSYKRDRNEKGTEAVECADFEALCKHTQDCGGEWLYVFKGGHWFCAKGGFSMFGMPATKAPEFLEHIDEVLIKLAKEEDA